MDELNYPDAIYLPILYATDKRGKERLWKTWTIGNTVYRLYGLVDGEKQIRKKSYQGVNQGKKNETTAEQQAEFAMNRLWTRQLDKKYAPKCKEGKEMYTRVMKEKKKHGGNNRTASIKIDSQAKGEEARKTLAVSTVKLDMIPMKAQDWVDKKTGEVPERTLKYFDFEKGVYVQWKLDGFRCIARLQGQDVVLTTNSGKQYPWLANLRKEIKSFLSGGLKGCEALDGELYSHRLEDSEGVGLKDTARFSAIQSICTQARINPHPLEDQICLYVFDLVDTSGQMDQTQRLKILDDLFKRAKGQTPHIKRVETHMIRSKEEISKWHGKFAQQGFEGIIIRDDSLKYRAKHRSQRMRKYKFFQDEEFVVVDAYHNPGVGKEYFVWVCETEDGKRFKATPDGTQEEKYRWYDNRMNFMGRRLTVKFQGFSADGIPRFPIGKAFRESGDI